MKKIFLLLTFVFTIQVSISQDLGSHYAIIEMTVSEYNKNNKPLVLILSNIIEIPLTENDYGIKVQENTKDQVRWQFVKYLNKNYKTQLNAFNGGFGSGKIAIWTSTDKDKLIKQMNHNFVKPLKKYKQLITEDFVFEPKSTEDQRLIGKKMKSFLNDGNPFRE